MTKKTKSGPQDLKNHLVADLDSIAGRVSHCIREVHRGSVNAAARDIGMSQRTLARIANGDVQNPRLDAVQGIASFYECDLNWLLTGQGVAPIFGIFAQALEVERLLHRMELRGNRIAGDLGLSDKERAALRMPGAILDDAQISLHRVLVGGDPRPGEAPFLEESVDMTSLWLDFLEEVIARYGKEVVARWVRKRRLDFERRFRRERLSRRT